MHRPVRIGSTATRIRDGGLARRTQFSPDYKAELVDPSVVFQNDKEEWRNGIGVRISVVAHGRNKCI